MTLSARAAIRAEVIDKMTDVERRELIGKAEDAIDNGYVVGEDLFEEYVGEILGGRDEEDEL